MLKPWINSEFNLTQDLVFILNLMGINLIKFD